MAKKGRSKKAKRTSGRPGATKAKAPTSLMPAAIRDAAAEKEARRADEGILIRGEAGRLDEQGNLPLGMTHEIVGTKPDGRPELKRRRFNFTGR